MSADSTSNHLVALTFFLLVLLCRDSLSVLCTKIKVEDRTFSFCIPFYQRSGSGDSLKDNQNFLSFDLLPKCTAGRGLVLHTEQTSKSRRYDNKMLGLRFQDNDWLSCLSF